MTRARQRSAQSEQAIASQRTAQKQGQATVMAASQGATEADAREQMAAEIDTDLAGLEAALDELGVPAGGTAGQVLAKASGTDYDADWIDPPAPAAPSIGATLCFHARGDAALVLTNQANAEQGLGNSSRNEQWFDSTSFSEVRISARVTVASASANSPRLYPQYWDGSAWATVGTGSGSEAASLATAQAVKTDWISLPAGAKADRIWRIAMNGGDGAADPAVGTTALQFR